MWGEPGRVNYHSSASYTTHVQILLNTTSHVPKLDAFSNKMFSTASGHTAEMSLFCVCPPVYTSVLWHTLCPVAHQVQDDIIKQLRIPHAVKLVSSFNRPNIHYSVRFVTDAQPEPLPHIVALLKEGRRAAADGAWPCSIIYALKKESTEEIAAGLTKKGMFSTAVLSDLSKFAHERSRQCFAHKMTGAGPGHAGFC